MLIWRRVEQKWQTAVASCLWQDRRQAGQVLLAITVLRLDAPEQPKNASLILTSVRATLLSSAYAVGRWERGAIASGRQSRFKLFVSPPCTSSATPSPKRSDVCSSCGW